VAKKQEVAGLPDPDKQQNAEMKSIVAAASDAVRPVQSVVSKKRGDYASYNQCIHAKIGPTGKSAILKCSEFSTLENREIKMQRKNSVLQYPKTVNLRTLIYI